MSVEDLCLKCGRCCNIIKAIGRGHFIRTPQKCQHYNPVTKLCNNYDDRLNSDCGNDNKCTTAEESIKKLMHPKDCPYNPPGYKNKVIND